MTTNQNTNTRTNEDLRDLPLAAAEAAEVSVVVSRPLGTGTETQRGFDMGSLLGTLLLVVLFAGTVNVFIWVADKLTDGNV